ncbi:MAG: SH3 domain-containing protein [Spirulina sp.]
MKILFLAANPQGTNQLQLDQEAKKIEDGLERSKLREQFTLVTKWAVDAESLRRAMLKEQPDIVHFSGHGAGEAGLVLFGRDDHPKPATADALSGLFEIFNDVKCVLLNACFAEVQAKAIVQHIDYVIGMKRAVRDSAAIAFATGFYDGLGYGLDIEDAFKLGCNAIQFEMANFPSRGSEDQGGRDIEIAQADEKISVLVNIADDLNPTLLKKEKLIKTDLKSVATSDSLAEKLRAAETMNTAEAIQQYRSRVKEFLADQQLNPIEEFQLATLAKVLGISDLMASQVVKEEQQAFEAARTSYRTVFLETIHKGYYPFNTQINQELKDLQHQLGLKDAEVEEITLPIILSYEKTHRSPAQRTTHPTPVTYIPTPQRKTTPVKNLALGALVAALGVATTLLVVNSSLRPSADQEQPPTADTETPADTETLADAGTSTPPATTPPSSVSATHPMGPTPGPNEVPAVIQRESALRIRAGQGTDTDTIGSLNAGEIFWTIPQAQDGWWPIRDSDGTLGYIHSSRINLNPGSGSTAQATNLQSSTSNNSNIPEMGPTPGPNEVPAVIDRELGGLTIRAGRDGQANAIGTLAPGEVFQVLPQAQEGWWPVRKSNGLRGYVYSTRITLNPGSRSTTEATDFHPLDPNNPNPPQGVRRATHTSFGDGFLVVRSGKTTQSAERDRLAVGEVFETIPQNETWWPVRTADGTLGYSSSRYIQLE